MSMKRFEFTGLAKAITNGSPWIALMSALVLCGCVPGSSPTDKATSTSTTSVSEETWTAAEGEEFEDKGASVDEADDEANYLSISKPYEDGILINSFVRLNIKAPEDDPSLGVYVVAPKTWHGSNLKLPESTLKNAGSRPCQLAEVRGDLAHVTLETYFQRDADSELKQFFEKYRTSLGLTEIKSTTAKDRLLSLVKFKSRSGTEMWSMFTLVRSGEKIFWLCGCAPASVYPKVSRAFRLASSTFTPVGCSPMFYPDVSSRSLQGTIFVPD